VLKVCRTPGPTACLKMLSKCVFEKLEKEKKFHDWTLNLQPSDLRSNIYMLLSLSKYKQWTWGPRIRGYSALFGSLYTSQLVLGTSASSLAANPLLCPSRCFTQCLSIRIISTSEKVSAFVGHSHTEQ